MRESLGPCCAPYCKKFASKILNSWTSPVRCPVWAKTKTQMCKTQEVNLQSARRPARPRSSSCGTITTIQRRTMPSKQCTWPPGACTGLRSICPNRGPWIASGRTLARLIDAIHRTPQLVEAMPIGAIAWCRHASRFRKEKIRVMEERQTHHSGRQR